VCARAPQCHAAHDRAAPAPRGLAVSKCDRVAPVPRGPAVSKCYAPPSAVPPSGNCARWRMSTDLLPVPWEECVRICYRCRCRVDTGNMLRFLDQHTVPSRAWLEYQLYCGRPGGGVSSAGSCPLRCMTFDALEVYFENILELLVCRPTAIGTMRPGKERDHGADPRDHTALRCQVVRPERTRTAARWTRLRDV